MFSFVLTLVLNGSLSFAASAGEGITLIQQLPYLRANGTAEHVRKRYPGLIVASHGAWSYLPEKPDWKAYDQLSLWASEHFAPLMTADKKLVCGNFAMKLARVSGELSILRLEDDGDFTLKVFPVGSSLDADPVAIHRLSFIKAQQLQDKRGLACKPFGWFDKTCLYFVPNQILNMELCDRDQPCRSVSVHHDDRDSDYVFGSLREATQIFGNGDTSFAKMDRTIKEYDEKLFGFDVYWAKFRDFTDEIQFKYKLGMHRMEQNMMLLAELKKACASPRFREGVRKSGLTEIVDAPAEEMIPTTRITPSN